MLSDTAIAALFDIRDNVIHANQFVAGFSFEDFKKDLKAFYAVTRALDGRRQCLSSHHDNVLERYVWHTLHQDLPHLMAAITQEIQRPGGSV